MIQFLPLSFDSHSCALQRRPHGHLAHEAATGGKDCGPQAFGSRQCPRLRGRLQRRLHAVLGAILKENSVQYSGDPKTLRRLILDNNSGLMEQYPDRSLNAAAEAT